jgi:DNA-binding MarR family transcriptional regulator
LPRNRLRHRSPGPSGSTWKAGRSPDSEFIFKPEDSLGFLIRDTHRAFCKVLNTKIAPEGVTLGMWFFLRVLWEQDGLTQRELSRRIGLMEPTTVSAISMMEKRGVVTRRIDRKDRRRRLVYLTRKGKALKQKLLPFAYEANLIGIGSLDDAQIEALRTLLRQIKGNLSDYLAQARDP